MTEPTARQGRSGSRTHPHPASLRLSDGNRASLLEPAPTTWTSLGDSVRETECSLTAGFWLSLDNYYEAGFAHSLGLPAFFTMRADEEPLHLDVRQFNTIPWSGADELRERLTRRMEATVGRVPIQGGGTGWRPYHSIRLPDPTLGGPRLRTSPSQSQDLVCSAVAHSRNPDLADRCGLNMK